MKRLSLILLLLFLLPLNALAKQDDPTVLVYMIGSDLESKNGLATKDIEEMQANCPDNLNLLLCLGGAAEWHGVLSPTSPTIYSVHKESIDELLVLPYESMASTNTLARFLEFSFQYYSSQNTILILWDHGSGPLLGFGTDEFANQDRLTIPELIEALDQSQYQGEYKFNWIGFDACLMGSIETAVALQPYAHYMIASEEVEMPCGWDYSFLGNFSFDFDNEQLINDILQRFYNTTVYLCGGKPDMMPSITLACYDLSKTSELIDAMDGLFSQVNVALDFGGFTNLARSRSSLDKVGRFSAGLITELVDIQQLVQSLSDIYPEQVDRICFALDDFIVKAATNNPKLCGLSVYFPYDNPSSYLSIGTYIYPKISYSDQYTNFITKFAEAWLTDAIELTTILVPSVMDKRIEVELEEELVNCFDSASFCVLRKDGDVMIPMYMSDDVDLNGNILGTTYDFQALFLVQEQLNSRFPIGMRQKAENAQYVFYSALFNARNDFFDQNMIEMQFAVDKTEGVGTVAGAYYAENVNYGKRQVQLSEWSGLEWIEAPFLPTYSDNRLLPFNQWQVDYSVYSAYGLDLKHPIRIEIAPLTDDYGPLFGQFVVKDVHGQSWGSELVQLTNAQVSISPLDSSTADAANEFFWNDLEKGYVLFDNDTHQISIGNFDGQEYSFEITIQNKSSENIIATIDKLAINGQMIDCWEHTTVPSQSKERIRISFKNFPFYFDPDRTIYQIQFDLDIQNADEFYERSVFNQMFVVELEGELTNKVIQDPADGRCFYAPYHMKPMIIYEDENICFEATSFSELKYTQETILYCRLHNKTDKKIELNSISGYLNEYMLSKNVYGKTLFPNTCAYVTLSTGSIEPIPDEENVLGLAVSWNFFGERVLTTTDVVDIPIVYHSNALIEPHCNSVDSDYCDVLAVEFIPGQTLSDSKLSALIRNEYQLPITIFSDSMYINDQEYVNIIEHQIYPNKMAWIDCAPPYNTELKMSPFQYRLDEITIPITITTIDKDTQIDYFNMQLIFTPIDQKE